MKKKIIALAFLITCSLSGFAQELNLPIYVNHMTDNSFSFSPAYAGIGTGLQFRLNGVSQWVGIKDAPDTQSLTVEARLADRFGGGLVIFNDKNGNTSQKGVKLSAASHLTLSRFEDSFLSLGITYSFTQFNINTANFSGPDSKVGSGKNINNSNFDVSMLYRYRNFSFSLTASNILNKSKNVFDFSEPLALRNYSLQSSYVFKRFDGGIEIEPSVYMEYFESDQRSVTDLNIKVRKRITKGYLWAGLSYTSFNDQSFTASAITPLVGLKSNNFYLSYGLGVNLSKVQGFNYGTHMITLGYDVARKPSLSRCTQKTLMSQ